MRRSEAEAYEVFRRILVRLDGVPVCAVAVGEPTTGVIAAPAIAGGTLRRSCEVRLPPFASALVLVPATVASVAVLVVFNVVALAPASCAGAPEAVAAAPAPPLTVVDGTTALF